MTVRKAYNLWCDACGPTGPAFDVQAWPEYQTAAEVRAAARREGWRRGPNGEDLCPEHAENPTLVPAEGTP